MAQMETHVCGHGSPPEQEGAAETVKTGIMKQTEPDTKLEPSDGPAGNPGKEQEHGQNQPSFPGTESSLSGSKPDNDELLPGAKLTEPVRGPMLREEDSRVPKQEQRENVSTSPPRERAETTQKAEDGRANVELPPADGEPLSRMDSEDSSNSMDMESSASSGRSTPALLNGHNRSVMAAGGSAPTGVKSLSYTCCWDHCQLLFSSSPDLAEHIRATHVDGQREGVFVCLWKGCKVYNTPSTSQSWLQRHMLTHSGDKPFKCVVGGCNATFASQGGLARHVPTHFSSQGSSKVSSQSKVKEESPSKAGLNKRRKLRNKYRRSLPRPHDFFDAQTMEAIRHRAICLNLVTHIESQGNGHSVVFHSTVIARRKENSGKVKVLLHWTPEDILPDVWVNEGDRLQLKTKVVHLSKLPTDMAVLMDPNIYRMFF